MKIKWLGHSCFLITTANNIRILTDPFDETVGYPLPNVEADIVTTSHDHFDHNFVEAVRGDFVHISSSGVFHERGVEILGVSTFHDKENGNKRGANIVYKITADGLNVCHLGDLGHVLTDGQLGEIGDVDILLVPVGGTYTIDYEEAARVTALINPKITIPMHFKTPVIDFTIEGVEKFLAAVGGGESAGSSELDITPENKPHQSKVIVLDYK